MTRLSITELVRPGRKPLPWESGHPSSRPQRRILTLWKYSWTLSMELDL